MDSKGGCDQDVYRRISRALAVFTQLRKHLWIRREISLQAKISIQKSIVRANLLYGVDCKAVVLLLNTITL